MKTPSFYYVLKKQDKFKVEIAHSAQQCDKNMSQDTFEDLNLSEP